MKGAISITEDAVRDMMRAHVAEALNPEAIRRLRRSILADLESITTEEAAESFKVTPRVFLAWARKVNLTKLPLGYKTKRWSVAEIKTKMKERGIKMRARKAKVRL